MPDHQLPEVSLANEEWDFSGCPKEEIFDCWVYEFSREYHRRHGSIPNAWRIWFPLGADFPYTPYLMVSRVVPSDEVKKLTAAFLKEHPLRPVIESTGQDSPDLCMKIDWQFSDSVLLKCIRPLLKEKRPMAATLGVGRRKEPEADLKSLGAFRLNKVANLTISQAIAYSKQHHKGAIKMPIYTDQPMWSLANAKVEKIMEGFLDEMAKHCSD